MRRASSTRITSASRSHGCRGRRFTAWRGSSSTWTVPLLLVANVPARTLLHGLDARDVLGMMAMTAALLTMSTLVFQAGLRRYGQRVVVK